MNNNCRLHRLCDYFQEPRFGAQGALDTYPHLGVNSYYVTSYPIPYGTTKVGTSPGQFLTGSSVVLFFIGYLSVHKEKLKAQRRELTQMYSKQTSFKKQFLFLKFRLWRNKYFGGCYLTGP